MLRFYKKLTQLLMLVGATFSFKSADAVVAVINATGLTGSYRTGSVNSAGTKNDGNMITINSSANRGFASFDLSTIPAGSIINSVSVEFTTYTSTSSTANNNIYGFTGDPSTIAGATLYTNAGSGTSFNATSWTANAVNNKTLTAAGITFIQNNVGGTFVNLGFVRGSTNTYNVNGYGTSTTEPKLTIDYTVPVGCTGPISPITASSTTTNACANTSFTITGAGVASGTGGVAFQWQQSPTAANTFSAISGATSANLTVASQTVATDYRLKVTCTNTNDSTFSNVVSIGQNLFYNCYCNPTSTCTNEGIINVTMGALNNTSAMCAGGYSNFASLGSLATFTQAQSVPISVTDTINSNPSSAGVWIDYDHNGAFDASEFTFLGSTTVFTGTKMPFTFSGNVIIPANALTGITRMRVRGANSSTSVASSGANGPCGTGVFGEYEDYLITINAGTACSAAPSAGTVASTLNNVACNGVPFILSATGFASGVTGLSFQWFESTDNVTFTPRGTASANYKNDTLSTGITQTSYYKLQVTCTNGNLVGNSNVVTVSFAPPPIPWTENFDAITSPGTTSFPPCWLKENGDWSTSAASAYNTSFSGANHLRDAWTATNEYIWTPGFQLTANVSYDLSFYVAGDGGTGWNVDIFQNSVQNSVGASQIGTTYTAPGTGTIAIQPYTKQIYTFIPSVTGIHYFAVRVNQPSSSPWYIAFDDFKLELTPNCPSPTTLNASNVTPTTADLQWVEMGFATTWQIEYATGTSFTPGSGTRQIVTANPYTLGATTALVPATQYSYFVRSICGPNDTSTWSARYSFTTQCLPKTIPFSEGFNTAANTTFPTCWSQQFVTGSSSITFETSTSNPTTTPYQGSRFAFWNSFSIANGNSTRLVSPVIDATLVPNVDVNFYWKNDHNTSYISGQYLTEGVQVQTSADGITWTDAGPFITRHDGTLAAGSSQWNQKMVTVAGGISTLYIGFKFLSGFGDNCAMDSVFLVPTPSCPIPTLPTANNMTSTTADLSWIENGTAAQWQIEYGVGSFTQGTGTKLNASYNTSFLISNLVPGTNYTYFVRSVCNPVNPGGDTSAWSARSAIFATMPLCPPPAALSATNRTSNSFDVNWTSAGGNVVLEYGPTGYTPGTGATAGVGGTLVPTPFSPQTISGLAPGTAYTVYIRENCVAASNGYSTNASLATGTTPVNDTCVGAIALTLNAAPVNADNTWATNDPLPTPACGSTTATTGTVRGLWYSFTAPYTGTFTIAACDPPAGFDNYARVYEGSCGSFTACTGFNDDDCPNSAAPLFDISGVASTTYYILLGNYSSSYGAAIMPIQVYTPLSVKLDRLSAVNVGSSNRIDWKTLSEETTGKFELQRSANAKSFETIYKKDATGVAGSYTYMDNNPLEGINYYRLMMKDAAGTKTYSNIVEVSATGKTFAVNAFPNPVSQNLTVTISGAQGAAGMLNIIDVTGKLVRTIKMTGVTETVNMSGLANGIYLIKYADASHTQTIRINKQ
jgi:hypothetical protein